METVCDSPLVVTVSTVYALSMAKYVCVRLKGQTAEVRVKADTVEEEGATLTLKLGGQKVGNFRHDEVQGWYIVEDSKP